MSLLTGKFTEKLQQSSYFPNINIQGKKQESLSYLLQLQKCLGIELPMEGKDLYNEDFKQLKNKMEEDTKKWKTLPWIYRFTNVKKSILQTVI